MCLFHLFFSNSQECLIRACDSSATTKAWLPIQFKMICSRPRTSQTSLAMQKSAMYGGSVKRNETVQKMWLQTAFKSHVTKPDWLSCNCIRFLSCCLLLWSSCYYPLLLHFAVSRSVIDQTNCPCGSPFYNVSQKSPPFYFSNNFVKNLMTNHFCVLNPEKICHQ